MVFGIDDAALAILLSGALTAGVSAFGGSKDKLKQVPTKTKEQKAFQKNQLQQAMGMEGPGGGYSNAMNLLQQYLNPQSEAYKNFEAPYLQEFKEQILPGIENRYASFGDTSGALSSSGFGQAIGGAAGGLQAKLAGLKAGIQNQSIGQLLNQYNQLSQTGLSDQFAYGVPQGGGGGGAAGIGQMLPYLLMMMNNGKGGGGGGTQSPSTMPYQHSQGVGTGTSGPYNLPTFMGW